MMNLQSSTQTTETKVSAQQKKFQRLSKKIEQEKEQLAQWQAAQKDVQARAATEIIPMYVKIREIGFQKIKCLSEQKKQKMTNGQLVKLDEKIEQIAFQLLHSQQLSEQQVKFLTDLLSEFGHRFDEDVMQDQFDAESDAEEFEGQKSAEDGPDDDWAQLEIENLKFMLSEEYDLEPDFFDFSANHVDEFMQKFAEKMQQREQLEFLNQFDDYQRQQFEREIEREKAREAKKAQQRTQAKKVANQSIKTIYLKIAAMIHPDREQNEQKKHAKTELLQQVNQAYEAKDLFALLAFQIELGQQQHKPMADQQLKAYNIVLEEQLELLAQQIDAIIYSFTWDDHILYSARKIKIQDLQKKYEQDRAAVKHELEREEMLLAHYQDIKFLKHLMRSQHTWDRC